MSWLPLVFFLAHVAEEAPRFPAWATRHFGATSGPWYVYSHVVLISTLIAICAETTGAPPHSWALIFAVGVPWTLACNALFHIATTALFREYSPGVVTGTLLFLPLAGWSLVTLATADRMTHAEVATALALGTVAQVFVVGSLWLPLDLDWRLRRRRARP